MRLASQSFVRLALAGALLLLFSPAAFSGILISHSRYVGVYESAPPDQGKQGPMMSVSLGRDGTATIMQDCGKGMKTTFGHWVDSGGQVTVTFDAVRGEPAEPPMVFESSHDGLRAVTWNHAAWGKVTPPLMKRQKANWHSSGHHLF